jgi:hypothetical protein
LLPKQNVNSFCIDNHDVFAFVVVGILLILTITRDGYVQFASFFFVNYSALMGFEIYCKLNE